MTTTGWMILALTVTNFLISVAYILMLPGLFRISAPPLRAVVTSFIAACAASRLAFSAGALTFLLGRDFNIALGVVIALDVSCAVVAFVAYYLVRRARDDNEHF